MAKKYNANPQEAKNFTQTAEANLPHDFQDYSEFLPSTNRTESIKRFFGATVNQLLSSGSTQSIDAYWGRLTNRSYNPKNEVYMPESDATRLNYQFQPGVVSYSDGKMSGTVSYINWLKRLESIGADLKNHDKLFSEPGYVLDLPVNIDMIINYDNYYWLEGLIPLVEIEPTSPFDIDEIEKRSKFTTPVLANGKTVEFVTGLRVKFTGTNVTSSSGKYFADYVYYVENVGNKGGIKLVPIEDSSGNNLFPSVTPYEIDIYEGWDISNWDIQAWDGKGTFDPYLIETTETRLDLNLNKTYIVMERWAKDKNPWARTNKWFSATAIKVATEYNDLNIEPYLNKYTRAARPIIEFHANMELYNFCKNFVELVDFVLTGDEANAINNTGLDQYIVNGQNALQDGDIVLVVQPGELLESDFNDDFNDDFGNSSGSSADFNDDFNDDFGNSLSPLGTVSSSYVVSGVGSNIVLTEHNTYNDDDYVVVSRGSDKGKIYCFKNNKWGIAQTKENKGSFPLFNLYDQNKTPLLDYPNNDFRGSKIFGYVVNNYGSYDNELGFAPSYTQQGSFSNYEFEWVLDKTRYNQNQSFDYSTEIAGYYFWKDWVEEEYYNGWSNVRGSQRVPVIQTKVSDGSSPIIFDLGTSEVSYPTEYTISIDDASNYRWYENNYADRVSVGEPNPAFVWKYDTDYTLHTLIPDANMDIQFLDVNGLPNPNIIVNVQSNLRKTVNVSSSYEYEKILYRSASDPSLGGEIFLSNDNQNRYGVKLNGKYLSEGDGFVLNGTQLTVTAATKQNDVVELYYIADADLDNAVYDVAPIHFYNSENKLFSNIGYDDLILHFSRQLAAMPGFKGRINGENNYHEICRQHNYDGLIRQQIFETKKLEYLLDQELINPIKALKDVSNDYTKFKKYFTSKVKQLWETQKWNSVRDLVDQALREVTIGKTDDFKYAHSDMAYFSQYKSLAYKIDQSNPATIYELPSLINKYGNTQNHVQVWLSEFVPGTNKTVERQLIKNVDYTIDGPYLILNDIPNVGGAVVNGTNGIIYNADKATKDTANITGDYIIIRWYDYRQLSHIPFSAVKLGFFRPTQVEVVNGELIGHDGSKYKLKGNELFDIHSGDFDVIGSALLDYELRVFNNLADEHFISDTTYNYSMNEFYPNPNSNFAYDINEMNVRLDDWFNRWAIENNVNDLNETPYDGNNEFTWNYKTVGPNLGSWRSLYVYMFGTDRPHTHPWEMLGHTVKPQWWDANYSWNSGPKRSALINALKYGIVGNKTTPNKIDVRYARNHYDWDNDVLVTTSGILNGPVTANVVPAPSPVEAAKRFVFGDWGDVEDRWRKSSEYLFALAEAYLQLKPFRTFDMFWKMKRWDINSDVTQEQWIDRDYLRREHNSELHNQVLTDGIISKVIVKDGGTGYSSLDLTLRKKSIPYQNAELETYISNGKVIGIAVINPGRIFESKPEVFEDSNFGANGLEYEIVIDFNYHVTHLGFNSIIAEDYVQISSDSTDLAKTLDDLDSKYMLHLGGFSDKRIINFELDGNYDDGLVRIPDSNYNILIDRNAPIKSAFYSGVKITKVNNGYQVQGYNLDSQYFVYVRPSTGGKSVGVSIGNVEVTKYLNWHNDVTRIPYKYVFTKRQDLYQFLLGLGKYYERIGFDQFESWEKEARDAIEWSLGDGNEEFYANGITDSLIYRQGTKGVVQTIDVNYDGVPNVLDHDFTKIRKNELMVLRDNDKTEIALKDNSDRIFGIGIQVVEYEHIVVIDNDSIFNDIFYSPEKGIGQSRIHVVGERTRNWNGRIEAAGYLVKQDGLILNFESSVRELEKDWISAESKALDRLTRQTIGYNVGYYKPVYLANTFVGDRAAYGFEKGFRKYKGTESAIEAMTRNINIFGEEFEHELYEDWMVRLGDYGDISEREPLQFSINPDKIKSNPQHFRFNGNFVSDKTEDLIIDMHKGSDDAISGNFKNPFQKYDVLNLNNTSILNFEQYQDFTRDAGLPLVDEIDYFLGSIDDIGDIYDPTNDYALIPNWSQTYSYAKGDTVRLNGKVYRLLVDSTGLSNLQNDIIIRGTQVFPVVQNGQTFIANGTTVTFTKTTTSTIYDTIIVDGTISNATVPSGSTLTIDGINVNFIKTQTNTNFSDIVISGSTTNPFVTNGPGRKLRIGYANSSSASLTPVVVNFDQLKDTLALQTILIDAYITAGVSAPVTYANDKIAKLESFRSAYVAANSVAAWQTLLNSYFDSTTNPDMFVNPEFIGSLVSANPGASWITKATDLIQNDLDLITALGGTNSLTAQDIINGRSTWPPTEAAAFDADILAVNTLFDKNATPNDQNENLFDLITFLKNNGNLTIVAGRQIPVTNKTEYVVDDITSIVNKINNALIAANAPADITANANNNKVNIIRTNCQAGYRLGIYNDNDVEDDLGFSQNQTDIETTSTTTVSPVDLTLVEAIVAINNANITGVVAQIVNNKIRLVSSNQALEISSSTAVDDLGLPVGIFNAATSTAVVPVDLTINDVVAQINNAGIPNLTAGQVQGALLLSYVGDQLIIGNGTANTELGISAGTYTSVTSEVKNTFDPAEWEVVLDPLHFNIWTIDNIGSDPLNVQITQNRYDVYQTLDFQLGIDEICAGNESGDDALVKCNKEHNLNIGDYVVITNSTCVPNSDGIWRVTGIQDEFGFFIDRFIEEKGFTGKVFPIRSVRFPTSTIAKLAMTDPKYVDLDNDGNILGLRNGDYIYVDEIEENNAGLGYGGVYQVMRTISGAGLKLIRKETGKTNNSKIKNGILYSYSTGETIAKYEVFDPLKGIIPGIADKEIDIRSDVDYAYYNNTTSPDQELREENAWGQEHVGIVWWDLHNAVYLNYDQGDASYRQSHWGELFPTSTIDIYEWTKSPVPPDQYVSAVESGTIVDGIELTGIPYSIKDQFGEIQYNWCEEIEINPNTNQLETYYYFWVKNKTTTPNIDRQYSVLQLSQIIENPLSQQVDWIAATSENTLLVTNLDNKTSFSDLVMKVNFNKNETLYHQEFLLLSENDPATQIPEWLHMSLRDSIAGFTQEKGLYKASYWNNTTSYDFDDVIISPSGKAFRANRPNTNKHPDFDINNDYWTALELVKINPDGEISDDEITVLVNEPQMIPDLKLHPYSRQGIETRPHQTWFKDLDSARKSLVEKLNSQLININIVDSNLPWIEEFKKTFFVGSTSYDLEDYWNFVDWSKDGRIYERNVGDYFVENKEELSSITSPKNGEIAHVEFSDDIDGITDRRQVYRYENDSWILIFKEKATIQFSSLLWDDLAYRGGWDNAGWDTVEWDRSTSDVFVEILDMFYNKIWINEYQPLYADLWFHMAKYVLKEQDNVDWIFKTSYFNIIAQDNLEKDYSRYFEDNIDEWISFINTAKPFRSKMRNTMIRKMANEHLALTLQDTAEIRVQTNPSGSVIDETNTRSFRLNVDNSGLLYSSIIVDEHKVFLADDIGPDDDMIPVFNYGVGTLPESSGSIWINGERIEYTGKIQTNSNDIGTGLSPSVDETLDGITYLTGVTRGTRGTLARSHNKGDLIEDETFLELVENANIRDYGNSTTGFGSDFAPAWSEIGKNMLDLDNNNPNGVAIKNESFGTIEPYGDILIAKLTIEYFKNPDPDLTLADYLALHT